MRFIVDECTGPKVSLWISEQSYEVFCVYSKQRGMIDLEILEKAKSENWIVITNDKDFGEMIIRHQMKHHGVILLRLEDERLVSKIDHLEQLLENHHDRLQDAFVVVTEKKIRFV